MKIGLIAALHVNLYGTEAVLAKLRDCRFILCAGDLTGYFNFVNETIALLRRNPVLSLRGNHDEFLLDTTLPSEPRVATSAAFTRQAISTANLDFLSGLPRHFLLSLDDLRIFVCHGSPRDLLNEYVYPDRGSYDDFVVVDADLIVRGHAHWPMLRRVGKTLIVNPGSCGQLRNGTAASGQLRYSGHANAKRGISSSLF